MFVVLKMLPFRTSPYSFMTLMALVLGLGLTQAILQGCSQDKTSFELVTGFEYSSPADIMDFQPGTHMLTDCIDMCRNNQSCMSVNYKVGLCVLFSSNADMHLEPTPEDPDMCLGFCRDEDCASPFVMKKCPNLCNIGALTESTYTMYVQKNCFSGPSDCTSPWCFERVMGYKLDVFSKKEQKVATRVDCQERCLAEKTFPCRSANFNNQTGECEISDMDRHTVVGSGAFKPAANTEFIEAYRGDNPFGLCKFQKMDGRLLKTIDSIYQSIYTLEACRNLCLAAPFRCHSFDYGDSGNDEGRLSHHAAATLTHIEQPYLEIDGASTYELSFCYNVTTDCRSRDIIARIETPFDGYIEAMGSPTSCVNDIESSSLEFEIQMFYNGGDTGEVSIGDPLSMIFEIVDRNSPYEIFVHDLIASDGFNQDVSQITLIDSHGCPTEEPIMRAFLKIDGTNGKVLASSFDFFAFPTSYVIQFRAQVTPCFPSCEPVICDVSGRNKGSNPHFLHSVAKRHSILEEQVEASAMYLQPSVQQKRSADIPDEFFMVQTNQIEDKFAFRAQQQDRENSIYHNEIFNTETNN